MCGPDGAPPETTKEPPRLSYGPQPETRRASHLRGPSRGDDPKPDQNRENKGRRHAGTPLPPIGDV
ncbi:hypothetical protein FMEAI12_2550006 [Parafrankia sp. Ea1.12]|nr:hypothetical protein FMEAI12_2550006 [Parafrankia sp. Ea1.12]